MKMCVFFNSISKVLQFSVIIILHVHQTVLDVIYFVKSNIEQFFEGVKRCASLIRIKMTFFLGDVRNWDLWHGIVGKCTMYNK